jgi:outer membrane lipoprotein SlyB
MDTSNPAPAAPALGRGTAWLVGGSLAGVALGSLATALALRGPGPAPEAEPRETIVSTLSPAPASVPPGAPASTGREPPARPAAAADRGSAAAPPAKPAEGTAAAAAARVPAAAPDARPACADCAVVQAVTAIERRGEATGLGAAGGAVAGGLIGRQMGGGSGQDAMTVVGAVGGGVAGHHLEGRLRSTTEYRVRVALADGRTRTLSHPTRLAVGDRVRVDGDRLVAQAQARPAAAPTRTAQSARPGEPAADRPRSMAEAKRL